MCIIRKKEEKKTIVLFVYNKQCGSLNMISYLFSQLTKTYNRFLLQMAAVSLKMSSKMEIFCFSIILMLLKMFVLSL